jgi:hypothetical protein
MLGPYEAIGRMFFRNSGPIQDCRKDRHQLDWPIGGYRAECFTGNLGPFEAIGSIHCSRRWGPFKAVGRMLTYKLAHSRPSVDWFYWPIQLRHHKYLQERGPARILGQIFILVTSGPMRDCAQNIFVGPFVCMRYMPTMGPCGLCRRKRYICTWVLPTTTAHRCDMGSSIQERRTTSSATNS